MNHTRLIRYRVIIVALVVIVLSVALIGLPRGASSSAEQTAVTRSPRPHPQAHIKLIGPGSPILNPRPHPQAHIRSTAITPASDQP